MPCRCNVPGRQMMRWGSSVFAPHPVNSSPALYVYCACIFPFILLYAYTHVYIFFLPAPFLFHLSTLSFFACFFFLFYSHFLPFPFLCRGISLTMGGRIWHFKIQHHVTNRKALSICPRMRCHLNQSTGQDEIRSGERKDIVSIEVIYRSGY